MVDSNGGFETSRILRILGPSFIRNIYRLIGSDRFKLCGCVSGPAGEAEGPLPNGS